MDPALAELLRTKPADQEAEVILRLFDSAARIPGIRVISRFGPIVTCRIPVDRLIQTRERDEVASLKAPRLLAPEATEAVLDREPRALPFDLRRPSTLRYTGRGCVVGFLDWGFAFAEQSLRHPDGSTRLLALWDQRRTDPTRPNRYGYGIIHDSRHLNAALATGDPYRALGYHPAEADPTRVGAHASHVADIAVGNGRGLGPVGLAPEVGIVCVHLGTEAQGADPLANYGDGVRLLEGVSMIREAAGGRPFVVSASIGRHGGPHDGTTLSEIGLNFLAENPQAISVHSAGNYHLRNCHASGSLDSGEIQVLRLLVDPGNRTSDEVEIWYDHGARFSIRIGPPGLDPSAWIPLGQQAEITASGSVLGRVYHRERDPQNGAHLIDLFIEPGGPSGEWHLILRADQAPGGGGAFHAWVERDDSCAGCQAEFHLDDADPSVTTSTIANASRTISVGAVDGHDPGRSVAPFSSAGPTRDGRTKPDCVAPGVGVLAAQSPWFGEVETGRLVRRSGTSMAAPHVAGCAALMLEAGRGLLGVGELRELILSTVDPAGPGSDPNRYGSGHMNVERAVAAAERVARRRATPAHRSFVDLHSAESHFMTEKQDLSARVLELVDQLVGQSREVTPEKLLRAVLQQVAQLTEAPDPRKLYRAFERDVPPLSPDLGERLRVVARPLDQSTESLAPGDLIVRRALGEPGLTHVAIVAGPELRWDELASSGITPEDEGNGWYVQVVEGGHRPHGLSDRFSRKVRDSSYKSLHDQVVLRVVGPQPSAVAAEDPEAEEAGCALVSVGPATRSYRPLRSDTIVVGGVEHLPPRPLLVRNWASPDVEQFGFNRPVYRPLSAINGVVLHETRGPATDWSPEVRRALENRENHKLAIHGYINSDGSLIQHMDLTELLQHGGYFNNCSIGFEIINPMVPGPEHLDRDSIPATWERGGGAVGQYLVPPLIQLEGVANLLRWLRGPPLNIPARWRGVRSTRSGNFFAVVPAEPPDEGPLNGVIGHGQYIPKGKSDGVFPALYCWLRIEGGLTAEDAYAKAVELLSAARVTTINLTMALRGRPTAESAEAVRSLRLHLRQEGATENLGFVETFAEDMTALPAAVVTAPFAEIFGKPDASSTRLDTLNRYDHIEEVVDKRNERGAWWYEVRFRTNRTEKTGWSLGENFSELAQPSTFQFTTPGATGWLSPFEELRDTVAHDKLEPKIAQLINLINVAVLTRPDLTLPDFVGNSFYHALILASREFKQASVLMTAAMRAFKPVAGGNFPWVQAKTTVAAKFDPATFRDKVWHFFWNAYERFSGTSRRWLDIKGVGYELKSRSSPLAKAWNGEPLSRDSTEDILFNRGGVAFADWVMKNEKTVDLHHVMELESSLRQAVQADPKIAQVPKAELDQVITRVLASPEAEREIQRRSSMDFAEYASKQVELVLEARKKIPAYVK